MASISAAILSFFAITGNCAVYEAIVPLEGSQEVPPIAVNTSGTARLRFESIDGQLVWEIEHNLGDRVTAAHFHGPADRGENAAIQINIGDFSNSYTSPIVGETFLNANQSFELFNGRWYINLHTTDYPGGEIRGQVAVTMNVLETWQEEFEYHKVLYPKSTDGHVEVFWSVFDDQWIGVSLSCAFLCIYIVNFVVCLYTFYRSCSGCANSWMGWIWCHKNTNKLVRIHARKCSIYICIRSMCALVDSDGRE